MSIAAWLGGTGWALSCPAAFLGEQLAPLPPGARSAQRLFVRPLGVPAWQAMPLQVDPIDTDGHLVFPGDASYLSRPVERSDLLTLRAEDFGERLVPGRDHLPCPGRPVFELVDELHSRYAYLTSCADAAAHLPPAGVVRFDREHNLLQSPVYQYRFNAANYMLFDSIAFRSPQGQWEQVATASHMLIKADVRNFFTMSFDSHEIESRLEDSRLGPLGDLARLSFFLRILFFKIQMSLSTDVGFYADSSHIPMMVNIPVDAFEYLNPASGILYNWQLSPAAQASPTALRMPALDVDLVHKGYQALGRAGLSFCGSEDCFFHYTAVLHGRRLAMDLGVKRVLVERGFYPQYVDDVARWRDAMGWEIDVPAGVHRAGMYFEVSGLPAGGHPWDFWMRLGGVAEPADKNCPVTVQVARLSAPG